MRTTTPSTNPSETIEEDVATQSSSVTFETATTISMPRSSTQKRYVSEGGVTVSAELVDPNLLNSSGEYFEVPTGHGLLIRLHSEDGSVSITTCPDRNFPEIHTHCYAPACMQDMKLLHGGGSGTAVFGGYHPEMQHIVMKHGSSRDTKEVFSLATIASELIRRQRINGHSETTTTTTTTTPLTAAEAALDMKNRIPEFVCVYISPFHLRDRGKELWASLRTITYTPSGRRLSTVVATGTNNSIRNSQRLTHDELQKLQKLSKFRPKSSSSSSTNRKTNALLKSGVALDLSLPRRILRVHTVRRARLEEWCVSFHAVDMYVPPLDEHHKIVAHTSTSGGGAEEEKDYAIKFLQDFCVELMNQEDTHNWKGTTMCEEGKFRFR
jgi:hypothetical protein